MSVVFSTLSELGVEKEMLIVFNKADLLTEKELENQINDFDLPIPFVIVNTITEDGLNSLKQYIAARKA